MNQRESAELLLSPRRERINAFRNETAILIYTAERINPFPTSI